MDESLTYEQIKKRYAPDWVVIGDLVTDERLELVAGKVLFHGPDRDTVYNRMKELPPGRYAVDCLAEWPEDRELVL